MRKLRLAIILPAALMVAAVLTISASPAQDPAGEGLEPGGPPRDSDVRGAMRELFDQRLRERLGLTDEQMAAVTPHLREMDEVRFRVRRERMEAVRALRHGLHGGMGDVELQELLGRLDKVINDERESMERIMAAIDRELTVRQRVQLRFFMEEFGRRMREKVRQIRGGQGHGPGKPHGGMHGGSRGGPEGRFR